MQNSWKKKKTSTFLITWLSLSQVIVMALFVNLSTVLETIFIT